MLELNEDLREKREGGRREREGEERGREKRGGGRREGEGEREERGRGNPFVFLCIFSSEFSPV